LKLETNEPERFLGGGPVIVRVMILPVFYVVYII